MEGCKHPTGAALEPNALVGVEHAAVAVEGSDDATVLGIRTVFFPEGENVV